MSKAFVASRDLGYFFLHYIRVFRAVVKANLGFQPESQLFVELPGPNIPFPHLDDQPVTRAPRLACLHEARSNSLASVSRGNGKGDHVTIGLENDITDHLSFFKDQESL